MKQPQLEDFNLTKDSQSIYDKQIENHNKVWSRYCQDCKTRNRIVGTFCFISALLLFIWFVVSTSRLNNGLGGSSFGCIILFFATGICPFIIAKLFYISDYASTNYEENKEQRFRDSLSYSVDKYHYVDKELEQRINEYNSALNNYLEHTLRTRTGFWVDLTGLQFEDEVASLFRNNGYDATVTSSTGDGGVDIILRKNGERIAVQCKHHSKPVGPNDVRALQGVVAAQNYSKGIFVSLNGYTTTVRSEIQKGNVDIELLELKDILIMAKREPQSTDDKQTSDLERKTKIQKMKSYPQEQLNNLLGSIVIHNKFGEGAIVEISQDYLSVDFSGEIKKFSYPNAFLDKYLTFKN